MLWRHRGYAKLADLTRRHRFVQRYERLGAEGRMFAKAWFFVLDAYDALRLAALGGTLEILRDANSEVLRRLETLREAAV